jgi:uncharacterized protein DUF4339
MKYYIQRELKEYGPYTLADLQRYIAQGSIVLSDLTRSEGMTEWVPVSQVIGNIPIPVAAPSVQNPAYSVGMYGSGPAYGTAPAYGSPVPMYAPAAVTAPVPPDFHWGLVLLFSLLTFGLFWWAWLFVQAAYVRKIDRESHGVLLSVLSFVSFVVGGFIHLISIAIDGVTSPWVGGLAFVGLILLLGAIFQIRSDLEDYYTIVEPVELNVNGVLTFFFNIFYLQHHFTRIAVWKKTGVLEPQGA